jgi:hypothetical protein
MTGLETNTDVLAELQRRLGYHPDEGIVDFLDKQGWIGDVLDDLGSGVSLDEAMANLVETYQDASRLGTRPRSTRRKRSVQEPAVDARSLALSRIFAIDADRHPFVREFRQNVLKGQLLRREEVPGWIQAQRSEAKRPALWGRVPISRSGKVLARTTTSRAIDTLAYLGPEAPWSSVIGVPLRGALRSLKDLAALLERRYGWLESEASTFVLTGLPPLFSARATVWHRSSWDAAGRIVLEMPITAKPREVLALFRRVRSAEPSEPRRWREPTQARVELAVFAFQHNHGRSWGEVMDLWNDQAGGKRRYWDVRQFAKACRESFRAVTGEKLDWPGRERKAPDSPRGA